MGTASCMGCVQRRQLHGLLDTCLAWGPHLRQLSGRQRVFVRLHASQAVRDQRVQGRHGLAQHGGFEEALRGSRMTSGHLHSGLHGASRMMRL